MIMSNIDNDIVFKLNDTVNINGESYVVCKYTSCSDCDLWPGPSNNCVTYSLFLCRAGIMFKKLGSNYTLSYDDSTADRTIKMSLISTNKLASIFCEDMCPYKDDNICNKNDKCLLVKLK
jgi:hypothetical protein